MTLVRSVIAALALCLPCAAQWTDAQHEWALGTAALLAQNGGDSLDVLADGKISEEEATAWRVALARSWDVHSREDLFEEMDSLQKDDRGPMKVGWNYPRAINLARWGFRGGYLTEAEAWDIIMPLAQRVQQAFSSWHEMGHAYLEARAMWYSDLPEDKRDMDFAYRAVVLNPTGPWRKFPWNLDIGNSAPVSVNQERTASAIFAIHKDGLLCAKLCVPSHSNRGLHTDRLYLAAVGKALGCNPHITGSHYDGPDWTLDAECRVDNLLHGTQIIGTVKMEAVAEQFRREGFTELIAFVQHEPFGISNLTPAFPDNYIDQDLQWYAVTRSLKTPLPDLTLTYGFPEEQLPRIHAGIGFFALVSLAGIFIKKQ